MRWKTVAIVFVALALAVGVVYAWTNAANQHRAVSEAALRFGGSVRLPALTGRNLDDVRFVIAPLHLQLGVHFITAKTDPSEVGTVLSQFPRAGSVVPIGMTLSLVVSAGPHPRADVVTCFTTSFWTPEHVVPAFIAEGERVLRPGGLIVVLNTAPEAYGGELHNLLDGDPEYERAVDELLSEAGFGRFDFETVQDYGTPERAIETYGFIFGSRAIAEIRRRGQSRLSWRWRLHSRTYSRRSAKK